MPSGRDSFRRNRVAPRDTSIITARSSRQLEHGLGGLVKFAPGFSHRGTGAHRGHLKAYPQITQIGSRSSDWVRAGCVRSIVAPCAACGASLSPLGMTTAKDLSSQPGRRKDSSRDFIAPVASSVATIPADFRLRHGVLAMKRITLGIAVLAVFASTSPHGAPAPADWPQWGGPHRDFVVPKTTIAPSWPAEGPKRLWSRPLGEG